MGDEFNIEDFINQENMEERVETVKLAAKKLSHSNFLSKKKLYRDISKQVKEVLNFDFYELQIKYEKIRDKDDEVMRRLQIEQK